jgi:molybdate transport system ATP-binding protein
VSINAQIKKELGTLKLDVNLQVQSGQRVAIVGPNGAGKTTLLRILCGLVPIDSGCVEIYGNVVDAPDDRIFVPAEARNLGYCPQDHTLFSNLRVASNVMFGLRAHGMDRISAAERANQILEQLQLEDLGAVSPNSLSVGQSQRVALARALVVGESILLLDEPTASLDKDVRPIVQQVINDHAAKFGTTVLIVTHDRAEAALLADYTIEIGQ